MVAKSPESAMNVLAGLKVAVIGQTIVGYNICTSVKIITASVDVAVLGMLIHIFGKGAGMVLNIDV
jgi:hypothetical protein